jgi:hypothetical protein
MPMPLDIRKLTRRQRKLIKGLFAGLSVSVAMKRSGYN